jgi:hypothetical protein
LIIDLVHATAAKGLNCKIQGVSGNGSGWKSKKADLIEVDLFDVYENRLLIHYSGDVHGIHAFFAGLFVIRHFVVLTDLIDET